MAQSVKIPGLEIAGEVAQVGPGVTRWNKGDKLMGLVVGGGCAEYCLAFASHARRRGDYVGRNYEAAAVEGRIVQIAFLASSRVTVDLMRLMLKPSSIPVRRCGRARSRIRPLSPRRSKRTCCHFSLPAASSR